MDSSYRQRNNSADKLEWNVHQHNTCVSGRSECEEQQGKNERNGYRQNHHQPIARTLQIFKLTAPFHCVSAGQMNTFREPSLGFGNETPLIASPDIRPDRNLPLIFATRDNARTIDDAKLGQFRQWNAGTVYCMHQNIA